MGIQRSAVAAVTLMLVAGGLAGCVSPMTEPPPPSQEEINAMREAWAQEWWDSMSTGTTMPDVDVIEELPAEEAFPRRSECLDAAHVPGVTVYGPGEWSYNGALGDDPTGVAAQEQWWICSQQYPSDGEFGWALSSAQLEWLYDFYTERHIPCLRMLGLDAVDFPSRDDYLRLSAASPSWLPYPESLQPAPRSSEWVLIAHRCPLPDMLDVYALPGYDDQGP